MERRELVHPRKVMRVMNDFINEIHTLTYESMEIPPSLSEFDNDIDKWFEAFHTAPTHICPCMGKVKKDKCCCAHTGDFVHDEDAIFVIGMNIEELFSYGGKQFRQDFVRRCPMGKGFADVTITLLHELGHFSSQQEFDGYDRVEGLRKVRELAPYFRNFAYFQLPDEKSATDWAIEWLNDPEHRKIAKAFEKKFFACFKKRG